MLLEVFDAFVEEMITVVETGDRIELRGFGVFNPTLRKARVARNPKTLETVNVPPRNAVTFKPGKDFKDRLNPKRSAATR
jgi:nucleoid DNA-binding protein